VNATLAAVVVAPGLALGSFLNVVVARVPAGRSIVSPGSACLRCGDPVSWRDNIPVLSFLLLRGRCRSCGSRIGWQYPVIELLTALLLVGCVVRFGLTAEAVVAGFFCTVLIVLSAIDLEHLIVPNRIVLPAAAAALTARTVLEPSVEWAAASLGAATFLFVAVIAYPKGMGMGDVKLALLLGAALGRTVPVAVMVGMLSALVPAAALFARHGVTARKHAIPFAPFLALGGVVALFAGAPLLDAYLSHL
jgi:leader peptidase (prepilin peptidase) / N-methyltransferase